MGADSIMIFALFIFSVIIHEVAHGVAALWLGDRTAQLQGRITLDPIKHIDPFMTILLPLLMYYSTNGQFMFGGAKPVPVDPRYFRDPRRGMMWTALAGPVSNILLAVLFALCFHMMSYVWGYEASDFVITLCRIAVQMAALNLFLALFNLIPIPPLDGGRVLVGLLPRSMAMEVAKLEPYGMFIILALVFTHATRLLIPPLFFLLGLLGLM